MLKAGKESPTRLETRRRSPRSNFLGMDRIRSFFGWWAEGLWLLLPRSVRDRISARPDRFLIEIQADGFRVRLLRDGVETGVSPTVPRSKGGASLLLKQWIDGRVSGDREFVLLLPPEQVARRQLTLPLGAEEDLRQVLTFELDRYTPFTEENACFDFTVTERDPGSGQIHLTLFATRRDSLVEILQELKGSGVYPDVVSPADAVDQCNLLAADWFPSAQPYARQRMRVWIWTVAGLFLAILYVPPAYWQMQLRRLESESPALRTRAMEATHLRKERDALMSSSRFLADRIAERPRLVDVVKQLTELLPASTWINRIDIQGHELQIYGESDSSSALIELLDGKGPFTSVQFESPVMNDPRSGRDRFHISAQMLKGKGA